MDQNARPDFYESQYLGAEDLDGVVDYGRVQRARHGLGAHTWGIAAGLDLVERRLPTGEVEPAILPGVAWDGYFRTITVLAPTPIRPEKFANFLNDTPIDGLLVPIWLRYVETAARPPAPGFEACRADDAHSRAVEGFAVEVGMPKEPEHGSVTIAGRSIDPRKARAAFLAGAPDLFDESIPHQSFPLMGNRPLWLVPIGYVRWLKLSGQPGRLIARNDTGAGGAPLDSDLLRAFRRYIGTVTEGVVAADGLIRLRDRGRDPSSAVSHVRAPLITADPARPPENDLVWVEGHLHVLGDARVSGGKLELRTSTGDAEGIPLALRRRPNPTGGRDLQVMIGAEKTPAGAHALAVGVGAVDPATGQVKPDLAARHFVVRDNGTVGVGIDAPPQLLTLGGDKNTRLEFGRISASLQWTTTNTAKAGDGSFAINMQSLGSSNAGADLALMRDRRQRLVLFDHNTTLSSQGGDVIVAVNLGEANEAEAIHVNQAANVGVGVPAPVAKLEVGGDLALDKVDPGPARILPAAATMIWNDGTWLRLNQNRDMSKPVFGVHTPGVLSSQSLNVGGLGPGGWADPGPGNTTVSGNLAIGAFTTPNRLHVEGTMRCTGTAVFNTDVVVNRDLVVNRDSVVNRDAIVNRDLFANRNIRADKDIDCGGIKYFVIPHPLAPEAKRLAHAAIEGPEAAVFYRGEGRLSRGKATIALPDYFEALTRPDQRTVQVTPMLNEDDDETEGVSALAASHVKKGRFTVRQITKGNPSQRFCWEVKAVRADVAVLEPEVEAGASGRPSRTAGINQDRS